MNTVYSRILIKRSSISGIEPTIPTSDNHNDGTWLATDLYDGEMFLNTTDKKCWARSGDTIMPVNASSATIDELSDVDISGTPGATDGQILVYDADTGSWVNENPSWEYTYKGFRLPTQTEWENEIDSWSSEDDDGAFDSPLLLPMAGRRGSNGTVYAEGSNGRYWSSTATSGTQAYILLFFSGGADVLPYDRLYGFSVRLIKDEPYSGDIGSPLDFDSETIEIDGLTYETVLNPDTGRVWLDRNLGASQVADAKDDSDAYGDLYQWGRYRDGHEDRTSDEYDSDEIIGSPGSPAITAGKATTAEPNQGNDWDGKFIISDNPPSGWLETQDDTLWQGVEGTNNPTELILQMNVSTNLDMQGKKILNFDFEETIDSVNGQIGTVVLSTEDLSEDADHNYVTDAQQSLFSFIDQDVTSGSSPTFDGNNFTGIPNGSLDETYLNITDFTQDSGILVGTGAGTYQEETGATLRTSIGVSIGTDVLAEQTIGIADDNLVEMDDADAADNDYAKFTANGLEGRSYAEVKTDLSLNNVPNIDCTNASNITTGTLPNSVIPPVGLVTVGVYDNENDMLAAVTEEGDVAVRTDENKTYMNNGSYGSPASMANWTELKTPTDAVLSVNGDTGAVTLTTGDLSEDADHNYVTYAQQSLFSYIDQDVTSGSSPTFDGSNITGIPNGALTIGIADDNLVEIDDADAADNDYAKFTANGLEGRSYAEVKSDLSLDNVPNTDIAYSSTIGLSDLDDLDAGAKITNVTDPTSNQDAASKKYVDDQDDTKQDDFTTQTITITVGDWSSGTTVTKTVSGVTATSLNITSQDKTNSDLRREFGVFSDSQDTDEITFKADSTPDDSITITVTIFS